MAKRHEIRLCGYGGQGIMLAGYVIGQAASVFEDKHTTFVRDYGPEARGGACRADVIISDEYVSYPYINAPSVLVAMSQQAYDKYHPKNRPDTLVIIDKDLVIPEGTGKDWVRSIPATHMAEELNRVAVANTVMVGFFTAVTDIISMEAMKRSVLASAPPNTEELNTKAFEQGYAYGLEQLKSIR